MTRKCAREGSGCDCDDIVGLAIAGVGCEVERFAIVLARVRGPAARFSRASGDDCHAETL